MPTTRRSAIEPSFRLGNLMPSALLVGLLAVSCIVDMSGPRLRPSYLLLTPEFPSATTGIVELERISIELRRIADSSVALDTIIQAQPADSVVDLTLAVTITASAEDFWLTLECLTESDEVVFKAGPAVVTARTSTDVEPSSIEVEYVGTGYDAANVLIVTPEASVLFGDTIILVAEARDSGGAVIEGTPVKWTSLNTNRAVVPDVAVGRVVGGTERGVVQVEAALLTHLADTIDVLVEPVPSAIAILSGKDQTGVVGTELAQPLVIEVTAVDGPGVPRSFVDFVTNDGGSFAQASILTDGTGTASNGWTLGPNEGTQQATATVRGHISTNATFTATAERAQVSVDWSLISAVQYHTCGVTVDGTAYCWGDNEYGQLGDGTNTPSLVPVPVAGLLALKWVGSRFYLHMCGLSSNGAAFCWGRNYWGVLGDGTGTDRNEPTAVIGDLEFRSLSGGGVHNCGITTDGVAYCWGYNATGQLGTGNQNPSNTPVQVSGGYQFRTITAGNGMTCGLTTDSLAYCWGVNAYGELGDGTLVNRYLPVPVSGRLRFQSLSAGFYHMCGVASGGNLYCWGANYGGQLGDGTTTDRSTPVAVTGGLTFASVAAGFDHTCGLTASGAAHCWGKNANGQLGDGTTIDQLSPVAVTGGMTFGSLNAGTYYTCGVTVDNVAYCWGTNDRGQLGNGSYMASDVPVRVANP